MSDVPKILDVADLIGSFASLAEVAKVTGVKPGAVLKWKSRGAIPARYHGDLIDAAKKKGMGHVTAEVLVDIHRMPSIDPRAIQCAGGGLK